MVLHRKKIAVVMMMKQYKYYKSILISILLYSISNHQIAITLQTNSVPPCNSVSFVKKLCLAATPVTIAAIALAITYSNCSLPTCIVASGGIVGVSLSTILLILLCGNCIYKRPTVPQPIIV